MKKVEILRINDPSDFWIAEIDSKKFLNLIHEYIQKENEDCEFNIRRCLDKDCMEGNTLVGIYVQRNKFWYRARIISVSHSFSQKEILTCFLVDSGETVSASISNCRPILSQPLKDLPSLAKHCSLYGIKPSKNRKDWTPSATQLFSEICKNECFIKFKEKTSNQLKSVNQVKIYVKLKQVSKILNSFDLNNNNKVQSESDLVLVNTFLVEYQLASYSKSSTQNLADNNEYFDQIPLSNSACTLKESVIRTENLEIQQDAIDKKFSDLTDLTLFLKSNQNAKPQSVSKPKPQNAPTRKIQQSVLVSQDDTNLCIESPPSAPQPKFIQLEKYIHNPNSANSKLVESQTTQVSDSNIFIHNSVVTPIWSINDSRIHRNVKDYLNLNGLNDVEEFDAHYWPSVIRGQHVLGIPNNPDWSFKNHQSYSSTANSKSRVSSLSYIVPLLSIILEKVEDELSNRTNYEFGFVKNSLAQSKWQNGPLLLIVCGSCDNAQRAFEIVSKIIEICTLSSRKEKLKALIIQGGGNEDQYEIPLLNGVDILITATPFCLLKVLGNSFTNLERLRYFVFDQIYLLLEKFPRQIKALMAHYSNLLNVNDKQPIAQFVLLSNYWSTKVKSFIENYLMHPAFIISNKLEASYFGQTHHILEACSSSEDKIERLMEIVRNHKNIILFTNEAQRAVELRNYLRDVKRIKAELVLNTSKESDVQKVVKKWRESTSRVLIIEQLALDIVNIDSARCVVHFDFPQTKTAFAKRLWFMRKFFSVKKNFTILEKEEPKSLEESLEENLKVELKDQFQLVDKEEDRLCSFIMITKSTRDFSEGLYNFLIRLGSNEKDFPQLFTKLVQECKDRNENKKLDLPLCPYIKTFGACMNVNPTSCLFRHRPNREKDAVKYLDESFQIPSEGFVRFKIAFIKNTNHFYINLISTQSLNREEEILFDKFKIMDFDMQLHFSNPENDRKILTFRKEDMYAYKDTETAIFKRINIDDILVKDGKLAYELVVTCIDYGCKLVIRSQDLRVLPARFKKLPPQAIEVYLCDLRPIDKDLNWSIPSKLFMADKLAKSKEFVGKIQLAAGNTLWLHPITSFKHLKAVDLVVCEDSVRNELIEKNYAVHYPRHMKELRSLFSENGLFVPRLEDELLKLKKKAQIALELLYDLGKCQEEDYQPDYAFLNKNSNENNFVYFSWMESPSKFCVQLIKSYNQLENLNLDIRKYINKIEDLEKQAKLHKPNDCDDELDEKTKNDLKFIERTQALRSYLDKNVFNYLTSFSLKSLFCLAKNTSDEMNRAKIVDIDENKKVKVLFVDYGDYRILDLDDLYPIPSKFIRILPFQAIECSLDSVITPLMDTMWSKEAENCLWTLTRDENGIYYDLNVFVLEQLNTENNLDLNKYSVRLCKKSYPQNFDLAHKLVSQKVAKLTSTEEDRLFSFLKSNSKSENTSKNALLANLPKQFIYFFIR